MKAHLITAAMVTAGLALGACAGAPPARAPPLVCQHYARQLAWARRIASPTLADAIQIRADIALDVAESHGRLHADALAMQKTGSAGSGAARRLMLDCQALGTRFRN